MMVIIYSIDIVFSFRFAYFNNNYELENSKSVSVSGVILIESGLELP
jgi:hypothetical protein